MRNDDALAFIALAIVAAFATLAVLIDPLVAS